MPMIYEQPRTGAFILSEANGQQSRENIVLAATAKAVLAGQLLAIGNGGQYVPYEGKGDDDQNPIKPAGVLYANAQASTGTQQAVLIARDAELSQSLLTGLDEDAAPVLLELGLLVR